MKSLNKLLETLHTPAWLFVLLAIVFILRIPSLFMPYSYGDEMIYLTLGEAIRQGVPLYSGIHDNKPPLLYLMAAVAGNLFWFKAILTLWVLATIFVFWKLLNHLFPKSTGSQVVGTSIFALLTTIPLLEGNIVNAELFMIGPTILAFIILMNTKLTPKNLLFSGALFSVSTLFKVPAAFDIPTIIFLWLVGIKKIQAKNIKALAKNILYLLLGFATPVLLTLIWYWSQGALKEYIVAAFLQNVGYLSSWRPDDVQESFITRNLPLIQRGIVVLLGLLFLYWKKNRLSKTFIFTTSWLLFSLFAVTLSERPYPHYLIQGIGPFSILMTILFTQKNFEQVLTIIPLTLSFFVPFYYNFWHYPTLPYYQTFVQFVAGQKSKEEYFASFGSQVSTHYAISKYLLTSLTKEDKLFVWGPDSSTIYALTKHFPPIRYVADYHIKDFSTSSELSISLNTNLPAFIVLLSNHEVRNDLTILLTDNYALVENINGAEIWKLLNPKVRSLLSP